MKLPSKDDWIDVLFPFLIIGIIFFLSVRLFAQEPPLPESYSVRLAWDPPPASDVWNSVNPDGEPVPLVYRVYHTHSLGSTNATHLTNGWTIIATTTNHQGGVIISNLSPVLPSFFSVTVSNYWFESEPSKLLGSPAPKAKIENPRLQSE